MNTLNKIQSNYIPIPLKKGSAPKNDLKKTWGDFYDKYSGLIYSVIFKMAANQDISEKILQKTFQESCTNLRPAARSTVLRRTLLRNAYVLTLEYLYSSGLNPVTIKPLGDQLPLINLLYFELDSLQEAGERLLLTTPEVMLKLRNEFNLFRSQAAFTPDLLDILNS